MGIWIAAVNPKVIPRKQSTKTTAAVIYTITQLRLKLFFLLRAGKLNQVSEM